MVDDRYLNSNQTEKVEPPPDTSDSSGDRSEDTSTRLAREAESLTDRDSTRSMPTADQQRQAETVSIQTSPNLCFDSSGKPQLDAKINCPTAAAASLDGLMKQLAPPGSLMEQTLQQYGLAAARPEAKTGSPLNGQLDGTGKLNDGKPADPAKPEGKPTDGLAKPEGLDQKDLPRSPSADPADKPTLDPRPEAKTTIDQTPVPEGGIKPAMPTLNDSAPAPLPVPDDNDIGAAPPEGAVPTAEGDGAGGSGAGTKPGAEYAKPTDASAKPRDGGDKPSPGLEQARANFEQALRDRQPPMTEAQIREVMQNMQRMEQRIAQNPARTADGSRLDPQEESRKAYDNMTRLARGDRQRAENGIPLTGGDVNNLLMSTARRVGDPENRFNQGSRNTCACESTGRQEAFMSPASYTGRIADVANTGQFTDGRGHVTRVDKESLRPTTGPGAPDSAGQIYNVAAAQYSENLRTGTWGENQATTYRQRQPGGGRGDTGESVVDRSGRVIGHAPNIDADILGRMKQGMFGNRTDIGGGQGFGPNFGRDTTLVNGRSFNTPNSTAVGTGQELEAAVRRAEQNGWGMPTYALHTGNWMRGGPQGGDGGHQGGGHAISLRTDGAGRLREVNNWNGANTATFDSQTVLNHGDFGGRGMPRPGQDGRPRWDDGGGYDRNRERTDNSLGPNSNRDRERVDENYRRNQEQEQNEQNNRQQRERQQQEQQRQQQQEKEQAKLSADQARQRAMAVQAQISSLQAELARANPQEREQLQGRIDDLRKQNA